MDRQPLADADGMVTLEGGRGSIGRSIGLLVFSVIWNVITWVILIAFLSSDETPWYIFLFFVPFVLIGAVTLIISVGGLVMGGLARKKVTPAVVKISRQLLRLGETFRVKLSQGVQSPVSVEAIRLKLHGEEWVRYTRGTSTYTDQHTFHEQEAVLSEAFEAQPTKPFDSECEFTIPVDSMHTFDASDNKIKWTLELRTEMAKWPDYAMTYPIEVVPRLIPDQGQST